MCNEFLTHQQQRVDSGELSPRTFYDRKQSCEILIKFFGKQRPVEGLTPADFNRLRANRAKGRSAKTLHGEITNYRTIFKYAENYELIEKRVRFGPDFKQPAKRIIRAERLKNGSRTFEAAEIRKAVKYAPRALKAMILLGINCGFGPEDCATLPQSAIDFKKGWIEHPRPKTAIERRAKLWPETIEAIQEAIANRPTPSNSDDAGLVFITKFGKQWRSYDLGSPITDEFRRLQKETDIYRKRRGFYGLRHTFQSIGDQTMDFVGVASVMGHADHSMAGHYREPVGDDRLIKISDYVKGWLFKSKSAK